MSHLTASPFQKPSPFDSRVPQLPTPPDTDPDVSFQQPLGAHTPQTSGHLAEHEGWMSSGAPQSEGATGRHPRVSTLSYNRNTGFRDPRDRILTRQPSKWLVVVLPPASVTREHGHLGHTLSVGPSSRLSHGMLMPLFPTMYGQLAVIAREFNFPSTAGLCLYLQMVENGLSMSPRISDENWSILWAHLPEARSPSLSQQQLPVCGRIEFDIDLTKARWWDAWLTSARRGVDIPFSVAPSVSHLRADSKSTFMDDQAEDANSEASSMPARPRAHRHVPRKLSLVDRLDSISLGSGPGPKGDDAPEPRMRNVLTPIRQEEEAKPADLGDRVRSWRASSSAAPTPMAAVGQLSLDPVNMPNTMTLESPDDSAVAEGGELNLEDFKWTASSKGPPEYYKGDSPVSSPRVQSVHLDRRAEGSVLLTPSTATTWGPWGQNDDLMSVSPMSNVIRLPSPDLGQRMLDDVPLTPSTATSWGPPLDWPPSPLPFSRPPSVDLGERMEFSRPVTPSTATSWGPPTTWPSTPAGYDGWAAPRSPDIGERAQWSEPPSPRHNLVFPYFRPDASTWDHVWPLTSAHQGHGRSAVDSRQTAGVLVTYPVTYPHFEIYSGHVTVMVEPAQSLSVRLSVRYPEFDIYPAAYPHFDIYPSIRGSIETSDSTESALHVLPVVYPSFLLYPPVYPYNLTDIYPSVQLEDTTKSLSVRLHGAYPFMEIYPAMYPHIVPYSSTSIIGTNRSEPRESSALPCLDPIAYPHFEIYQGHSTVMIEPTQSSSIQLAAKYPEFDIYPAAYPHFDIYPSVGGSIDASPSTELILHGLPVAYPYFLLYPPAYPYNLMDIYPTAQLENTTESLSVRLNGAYPFMEIYPAVYPHIVPYPSTLFIGTSKSEPQESPALPRRGQRSHQLPAAHSLTVEYPTFDLHPAVQPTLEAGLAIPRLATLKKPSDSVRSRKSSSQLEDMRRKDANTIGALYPAFQLYPPVYPHFELYPSLHGGESLSSGQPIALNVDLQYPLFIIYPAVYPHFDLYRSLPPTIEDIYRSVEVLLTSAYPSLTIYRPIYPTFEIYPGHISTGKCGPSSHDAHFIQPAYPQFDLYPAVYPYFDIYRSGHASMQINSRQALPVRAPALYPAIRLYSPVYPHFEIWPSSQVSERITPTIEVTSRTHDDLHREATAGLSVPPSPTRIPRRVGPTHDELYEEVVTDLSLAPRSPREPVEQKVDKADDDASPYGHDAVERSHPTASEIPRHVSPTFPAMPATPARPARPGRSRSGTITRPAPPSPKSSGIPILSSSPRQSPTSPQAPSTSSLSPSTASPSGPSPRRMAPPVMRRFSSSSRPASAFIPPQTSLSPVNEDPALGTGAVALGRSQSTSAASHGSRFGKKRNSIVLERMKFFETPTPAETPARLTMKALSQFPMPPVPPVPPLPKDIQNLGRAI